MNKLFKNYYKNIIRQSSGNIIAQLISVLSLPVITRLYTPNAFADFRIFIELIPIFAIFCSCKIEHCVMLEAKERRARIIAYCVSTMSFVMLLALSMLILIIYNFDKIDIDSKTLALLPLAGFLTVFSQAFLFLDQRSENFTRSGLVEVLNKFSNNLFTIIASLFDKSSFMLSLGTCLGFLTKIIFFRPKIGRILLPKKKLFYVFIKIIRDGFYIKRLLFLSVSDILLSVVRVLPIIYISFAFGENSAGQFGLVTAAIVFPTVIFGRAVGQVFYQKAASNFNKGEDILALFMNNILYLSVVGACGYTIVGVFGKEIFSMFFGSDWIVAGKLAQIYAIAGWISFISIPFERIALIVNSWWYTPSWYLLRLFTTLIVVSLSYLYGWKFEIFIISLSIQVSLCHFIDLIFSYYFCRYRWSLQ